MATITTITRNIVLSICSGTTWELDKFIDNGTANEYILFAHRGFFYSYPEFGKQWHNGKLCQYHKIDIKCHLCEWTPPRNYAGVGNCYLLNNGIGEREVFIHKDGKRIIIPTAPRHSQMIILCPTHIRSYTPFQLIISKNKQLSLNF